MTTANKTNLDQDNTTLNSSDTSQNSVPLFNTDSILAEYTDQEVEEVMSRIASLLGGAGQEFLVGFQNDREFLRVFGSQYS